MADRQNILLLSVDFEAGTTQLNLIFCGMSLGESIMKNYLISKSYVANFSQNGRIENWENDGK